jgi:hypothetical protein
MRRRFCLMSWAIAGRILVRGPQYSVWPEPRLLEVIADEITLTLAYLIEMADERIFSNGLRGQVQVLDLLQLRLRCPGRGLGVLCTGAGLEGAALPGPRSRNCLPPEWRRRAGRLGNLPALRT